jgi:hypothetical protein
MMPRQVYVIALGGFAAAGALGFASLPTPVVAQPVMQNENSPLPHPRTIKSVGPDQALTYPKDLFSLPDMHTTFMPSPTIPPAPSSNRYLVFAAAGRTGTKGGAQVLETSDLKNFMFAAGYSSPVMGPPLTGSCNPAYDSEFDENYAAPGSVVQDPTRPPGNFIMIYHAENHRPGGNDQTQFYATIGLARSRDHGKTWPTPVPSELGSSDRRPVLKISVPEPNTSFMLFTGDAGPSAFVHKSENGDYYLYVTYQSFVPDFDGLLRVARAKLMGLVEDQPVTFQKWQNEPFPPGVRVRGAFTQPGIGGLDGGGLPSRPCSPGFPAHGQISHIDALGLFLMTYVCESKAEAAWY